MKQALLTILFVFFIPFLPTALLADFGLKFTVGENIPVRLDNPDARLSFRFQAPFNTDLQAVALHCSQAQDPPAYLVFLYADRKGKPAGTPLAQASFVPKAMSWSLLTLDEESLSLEAGRFYHWIIQWDEKRGGKHKVGVVDAQHWAAFSTTKPFNDSPPRQDTAPLKLSVLIDHGKARGKLKPTNLQAVFLAEGRGRHYFGNPYSHPLARSIHGNGTPKNLEDDLWQAQVLHFHCGTISKTVRLRVRTRGNPSAPLKFSVFKHDYLRHKTRLQYTLDVKIPNNVSESWRWVEVTLPGKTGSSFSPDCQYFALHSISGNTDGIQNREASCQNCYQISGARADTGLSGAQDITFDGGAHQSRASWSIAGKHWNDDFNGDLNIYVDGQDCSGDYLPLTPIPTPANLLGQTP